MKIKRIVRIVLIVLAAFLGLAILLGSLNALVGNGEWTFGWTAYRYDDTDFAVGDGTLYTDALENIDIDWVDGHVRVVACDDFCPSLTESSSQDLTEESRMRWHLSEDGKTLTVKYRKSSSFLGSEENKQKDLILRIPKRMFDGLGKLTVNVRSTEVTVEEIPFSQTEITSTTGSISHGLHPKSGEINVKSKKGDVCLFAKEKPSVTLSYETKKGGTPVLDFVFEEMDGKMVCGEGATSVRVVSDGGKLTVKKIK